MTPKTAAKHTGTRALPGAPTAWPHKQRMEIVRATAKHVWERTPEGQKHVQKEHEIKVQREADWRRENEYRAQKRREHEQAQEKKEEATRQARARKDKWKNNDEVSGTYKLRWQVYWQRRSDTGPVIDDGAEWFPFGTDSEGRVAWRRPTLKPKPDSSLSRDA